MARLLALGLLLITSPVFGQEWAVDSASISFQIKNAGITVNGTFNGLQAQIDFNPKKLGKSQITASVDAGTVDTGIRIRNKHLRKPDFFHVDIHPHITLKSQSFQSHGTGKFVGAFTINLKGKEKLIAVPFTFQKDGSYALLQGSFEIDRSDYQVGDKSLLLADNVRINIWVKASK